MSAETEKKEPRTLENVNQEYTALCAQYGDKQFKIRMLQSDCDRLASALNRVETEARSIQLAAKEAAAAESNVTSEGTAANA